MHAHKVRVSISKSRELLVRVPDDFPEGDAELILIADALSSASGAARAARFRRALEELRARLPVSPELSDGAFDRGLLYERGSGDE
ncbi:MAG: hypothetical protein HY791_11220 [Deltaproteobacteria bacterium]|nr:hypothetical protein [Deltaproteobacteria bacterium]